MHDGPERRRQEPVPPREDEAGEDAPADRSPSPLASSTRRRRLFDFVSPLRALFARLSRRRRRDLRGDLEAALRPGGDPSGFSARERSLLRNALALQGVRVRDVMVARAEIAAIARDTPMSEVLRFLRRTGHSRLPVFGETLDEIEGMIHIRDVLDLIVRRAENGGRKTRRRASGSLSFASLDLSTSLASTRILRPVLFVPPSMPAADLLSRMQATRTHMALVVDEYGGIDGLVCLEDLVETVLGDIEDEHDLDAEILIEASGPDSHVADARASLEAVFSSLEIEIDAIEEARGVDTIGGLVVALAGRVPARAELIAGPADLEFEVLEADLRRIKRIRIHRRASPKAGAPGPSTSSGRDEGGATTEPAARDVSTRN